MQLLRTINGKTFEYGDPEGKKEYLKEYHRQYNRLWFDKNRALVNAYARAYYASMPEEKKAERRAKRRAKLTERYSTDEEFAEQKRQYAMDYYHNKGGKEKARQRYLAKKQSSN